MQLHLSIFATAFHLANWSDFFCLLSRHRRPASLMALTANSSRSPNSYLVEIGSFHQYLDSTCFKSTAFKAKPSTFVWDCTFAKEIGRSEYDADLSCHSTSSFHSNHLSLSPHSSPNRLRKSIRHHVLRIAWIQSALPFELCSCSPRMSLAWDVWWSLPTLHRPHLEAKAPRGIIV